MTHTEQHTAETIAARTQALKQERTALEAEIKAHKTQAIQHREQVKTFLRQGVESLPEKQQEKQAVLQQQEETLRQRLEALQNEADELKKLQH